MNLQNGIMKVKTLSIAPITMKNLLCYRGYYESKNALNSPDNNEKPSLLSGLL